MWKQSFKCHLICFLEFVELIWLLIQDEAKYEMILILLLDPVNTEHTSSNPWEKQTSKHKHVLNTGWTEVNHYWRSWMWQTACCCVFSMIATHCEIWTRSHRKGSSYENTNWKHSDMFVFLCFKFQYKQADF